MGLIYIISFLFFVFLLVKMSTNKRIKPYVTKRVVWTFVVLGILPIVNTVFMITTLVNVITKFNEYRIKGKEVMTQECIEALQALDAAIIRLTDKLNDKDDSEIDS